MISSEILVNTFALREAITNLKLMRVGTRYSKKNADMFMLSDSKTADVIVELYQSLQVIERTLLQLIDNTVVAMEQGGVSFDQADVEASQYFEDIIKNLQV